MLKGVDYGSVTSQVIVIGLVVSQVNYLKGVRASPPCAFPSEMSECVSLPRTRSTSTVGSLLSLLGYHLTPLIINFSHHHAWLDYSRDLPTLGT